MKKPNVVLMYTDDLGYGDVLSFNPNSKINTENIDRLASEGMSFTNAHTTSSWCTPSRYGLLTGRYNWRSGMKSDRFPMREQCLIEDGRMTLADLFKNQGYKTYCIGKWHLGMHFSKMDKAFEEKYGVPCPDYRYPFSKGPIEKGFDYFYGLEASLNYGPHLFLENDKAEREPDTIMGDYLKMRIGVADDEMKYGLRIAPGRKDYDPRECCNILQKKVMDIIDAYEPDQEPFFIYYPTPAVHFPSLPSLKFLGKSKIDPYCDFVLQADSYVGEIMDKLKEKNIDDNTVFIFASDNGCCSMINYPALLRHGHNPSYIFRGHKGDIYEGGHRVPYIVKWPGITKAGMRTDQLVSMADIFRTFADYFGVELEDDTAEDSVSNLELWKGKDDPVRENITYSSNLGCLSIQEGNWKLEMCGGSGGEQEMQMTPEERESLYPKYQLYNMDADVCEHFNVIESEAEITDRLAKKLKKIIEDGRSTPGKEQKNTGEEQAYWEEIKWVKEF